MKNKSIKKLVSAFLIVYMMFSSFSLALRATATATSDIKGHWAESRISSRINKGLIKGYDI
jgi:hypothetical protein